MNPPEICIIGDNCVDLYPVQEKKYAGGNAVNTAVAVKRNGIECGYLGIVGNDDDGKLTIDELQKEVVDCQRLRQKEGTFWVVQDGYDVTLLQEYCSQHQFKTVQKREIFEANRSRKEKIDRLNYEIIEISRAFFHDWYPRYEKWLGRFIDIYLRNIVSKLPSVVAGIKKRMMAETPQAVLYAIGSETVLEESVAHVANDLKTPIYYFKHGGAENMFPMPSIFDKYLERNPVIKRTQFVHNHFEQIECKKLFNVKITFLYQILYYHSLSFQ